MKKLAVVLAAALLAGSTFAQTNATPAPSTKAQSDKGVASEVKTAGKKTEKATKKTGKKVEKTTKKAAKKTGAGASSVEKKTVNTMK